MVLPLSQPVLTLKLDNLTKMENIDVDELSTIWSVFTKTKDNLENGRRLENLSWRLWTTVSPSSFHKMLDAATTRGTLELDKFRRVVDSKNLRKGPADSSSIVDGEAPPPSSRVARARATASVAPQQFKPASLSRSLPRHSPRTLSQSQTCHNSNVKSSVQATTRSLLQEQLRMLQHQRHQQQLLKKRNPLAPLSPNHSRNTSINGNHVRNSSSSSSNAIPNRSLSAQSPSPIVNGINSHTTPSHFDDPSRKVTFFISESSPDSPQDSSKLQRQMLQLQHNHSQADLALRLLQQQHESTMLLHSSVHQEQQMSIPPLTYNDDNHDYDDDDDISDDDDDDISEDDDDISDESDFESDLSNSTPTSPHKRSNLFQKVDVPASPRLHDAQGRGNDSSGSSSIPRIGGGASRTSLSLLSRAIENSELKRAKPSVFSGLARIVAGDSVAPPLLVIPNEADLPPPPMVELSESLRQNLASERRMPFGAVIARGDFWSNGNEAFRVADSYSELSGW
ncbi:hypothetical protein SeLEV6574_g00735 [Synchytrium endobioticum]|nr:hypothetical protein SeLEV6574_g00735 [Synchytrium endobioticum]